MRLWVLLFPPSVALLCASVVQAIFADEAYQTDYHLPLLGFPQAHTTFFHRPSAASKASLLYTLSDRLILGAVNPKDGGVVWRQKLGNQVRNATTSSVLKAPEGGNTLVSVVDGKIQTWDATDGRLVWEWQNFGKVKGIETFAAAKEDHDVLALSEEGSDTVVRRLAADNGELIWEHRDASGDVPYSLVPSKDKVFYISLHSALLKGFRVKVTELHESTGKQSGQTTTLSSEGDITVEDRILHVGSNSGVPLIIWTDKPLKTLKINILGTKHVTSVNIPSNGGESAEEITILAPRSAIAAPHFLVHYRAANSHWAEVYHIDATTGTLTKAFGLPKLGGKGAFSANSQGSNVYFSRHTAFENTLVSSAGPTLLSQWNVRPKSHGGMVDPEDILHAASEVLPRGASTYAVRSALALPSGDWELIRNGEPSWVRPEGLAGVIAAAFLEIPSEKDLAREIAAEGMSDPLTAYVHRIKRHIKDLQYFPEWVEALPNRVLGSFLGDKVQSEDRNSRRDAFGFHKIILIATEHGRLGALDTSSQGKLMWNIQAVTLEAGEMWDVLSIEAEEGTALVRAKGGEFLRVVAKTGEVLHHQSGGIVKSLKTTVPVLDASGENVLIPINVDGSVGAIPEVDFGKGTVVVTEGKDGSVKGWKLRRGAKPDLIWQFTPALGQKMYSVNNRPPHDPVASIGKALGDRNVLYKYLNANLLLITTVGAETSTATFYVLDATSGAVVYSVTHPGIDKNQPIVSTISENWFSYSLYSESMAVARETTPIDEQKLKGYQLVVSEFYESPHPNDHGPLGSSPNSSSIYPTAVEEDDISATTPHVIIQTYLLPGPISSMSVTSTLQGITTRSLLCVLPELNSLFSISRAFIDARRPVGRDPTAPEAEEGLFRYSPILDFEPKWILSHKRDIISLSNVITSPSLLESTSLVFAFGKVDLFGTRISPIGSFDILGKGFGKLQLVLTVLVLALGTTFVAPFVRKKQIDGTWKA
ncbi:hypothetical protein JMJ35_004105 [Cladonia borealis]|uniref:ER membrane protein complex subunit 1 n=1 Tax=Cladonia borealis TaxID=184061 RepID=A0AA39V5W3_9LECA|nr:hypothetical protein JMJ35_004105 [Cladonia borealis]